VAAVAAVAAALVAALAGAYAFLRRTLVGGMAAGLRIVREADDTTEIDPRTGAVRSVQSAEVVVPADTIEAMWSPQYLERLARTYWAWLPRATLGLVRVFYTERERYVCLLVRPLKLLTFRAPEYEMDDRRGVVRWRIERGLLVARTGCGGDGYLEIDVERRPADSDDRVNVAIEVEVANFYPAIAAGFSMPVYEATQSSIHVLVTHAFLRSLAKLDLAESRVGTLAPLDQAGDEATPEPERRARAAQP